MTRFGRVRDGTGWLDWAALAFDRALAKSTLDRCDIDALVMACESDVFTLQLNPVAVLAQELGLSGVAVQRVEGGGASGQLAVHAGVARILSGLSRQVAVVGVDATASALPGDMLRALYSQSYDARIEGLGGITSTQLYALSWQMFAARQGMGDDDLARVTIAHRGHAMANPDAHLPRRHTADEIAQSVLIASPYRRLHCSPLSDGAAAVILSGFPPQARKSAARITGIGAASDLTAIGARAAPGLFAAKTQAMQRAGAMAGIGPADISLAEVYDPYAGAALQSLDALGLAGRDGDLAVNLSGGLLGQGAAPGATGIAQTGACALMLEGRYHPGLQPSALPAHAVADTHGGLCSVAAVTVLSRGVGA
ncbi:MAG: thiolase family protein [Gemmobacter sp.]